MSSGILILLVLSPILMMVCFCAALVWLQRENAKERDEITKKLMAKHLTEYQQEKAYSEYYAAKKEEVKQRQAPAVSPYLTMAELENDPEALEQVNNYVESITR